MNAGHRVTAWTRNPESARRVLPARCDVATWRPATPPAAAQLRGVDSIVHLAGESVAGGRWTAARKREIAASRIASSRALVQGIASLPENARPGVLVAASAIGFYGDRGDEKLVETSAPGEGFLAGVCRDWEREVLAAGALGVRAAALRVGIVLGRDGGALRSMLPPFRLGLGGRLGSGRQWMSWIHVDDVVGLLRFALEEPRVHGPVNAVAPAPATNAEFTRALATALGRPALLPVPAPLLRLALGEMSAVLLASQRVEPSVAVRFGYRFCFPSLALALADVCHDLSTEIVREQILPRPVEEIFPFFADARNLERITPPFLHFEVREVRPEPVGEGTEIDYRLRLHGVPLRWRSVIESWKPGRSFVDRQLRGPYALWHHTHEFIPVAGGTLARDHVRYALPFGALGELVAGAFVARDLERVFDHRREALEGLFGRPGEAATRRRDRAA